VLTFSKIDFVVVFVTLTVSFAVNVFLSIVNIALNDLSSINHDIFTYNLGFPTAVYVVYSCTMLFCWHMES
jgi:hypothetical protein